MISFNGKDMYMYSEYWCMAQFCKNETATMFFLKKPFLVGFSSQVDIMTTMKLITETLTL